MRHLQKFNDERRLRYDKEELKSLYLKEMLSIQKIADMWNVGFRAVRNALLREHIPLRKRNTSGLPKMISDKTKEKLRISKLGPRNPNFGKKYTQEQCSAISERGKGRKASESTRQKMSDTRRKRKLAVGERNPMSNPSSVRKWAQANNLKPNRQELKLKSLLDTLTDEFVLNVSGTHVIGNKIPDFVSVRRARLIELYGDYWHRGEDELERINLFKKYGYDTLIIWESELNDGEKLLRKIAEFIGSTL